ncbi:TonB-dependent receptor [Halosquirtibacter xylanolyticus]|uniref:SusC/RagA family TonB-linked outer membrane protein n=1 Tax=Halosquirtibacter xylanolyticus TaxID=3374599 RepID=UPI00374845CE|nr:TonB-dependent receptor [Prolixibacteraceae bacterium]
MKNCKLAFICFLLFLLHNALYVQGQTLIEDVVIKGKVFDDSKMGMPSVNVIVKGSTTGTITDFNGNYTIKVKDKKTTLVFSYMGYLTQEVVVKKQKVIDIVLKEDVQSLSDVVVVAYGTKTKATLTGAISTVGTEELTRTPTSNVTQALAGTLPGVATVQTSGQPGHDAAKIYIRGSGSLNDALGEPLVLVDGVEREFANIDENEIASLSILKDASSTAVFGIRGANGVILVTTRRGGKGKPKISVSSSVGLQEPISLRKQAGSYDYARMWNIRAENDQTSEKFTREQVEAFRTHSDPIMAPDIDWQDYMFNKYFIQNKNNVNISGGGDKVSYFVSLGYMYQNGLMKEFDQLPYDNNYKYDRYNYRANIDASLTNTTKLKINIGGNIGKTQEPIGVENVRHIWNVATVWSVPFAGPGLINGKRTVLNKGVLPSGSKVRDGLFAFYGYGYKEAYNSKINFDVDIDQKLNFITKGLKVGVKASNDYQYALNKRHEVNIYGPVEYQTAYYASQLNDPGLDMNDPRYDRTVVYVPVGNDKPLKYKESFGAYKRNWYLEGRLNYSRTFNNHKITGLFLYNQSRVYYPRNAIQKSKLAPYSFMPRGYVGYVGRITYGYQNKYLLDANVGYNGSENFAPGKETRYGLFPSVSGGWVLSEESFLQGSPFLSYLKLRASWGLVGNDKSKFRFLYMPGIWSGSGSYSYGIDNPNSMPASVLGKPGNQAVTWETAAKQNYAIDMKLFDNHLSISADVFFEHRTDILENYKTTPSIIATSLLPTNLGEVDNHGYEVQIGWRSNIGSDFKYNINANMSYAKNKIIFMDEVAQDYDYMMKTGGSTGRNGGLYQFDRMYQYSDFAKNKDGSYELDSSLPQPFMTVHPGDAKYSDLNGDGIINSYDTMVDGYSRRPEYVFGLNGGFQYKGFGFNMQWTGATHVSKLLEADHRVPFTNGDRGLLNSFVNESWTDENQFDATMPRLSKNMEKWNQAPSTLWLKDASYIRLKTVNVSYTFKDSRFLSSMGLKSFKVDLSGYNLLTFTKLKLIDPEALADNKGSYPLVRVYSLGVKINF